jgi:transposase InsO family protein
MTRAELSRMVKRYRRVCRRRDADEASRLTWHRPGAVWAMDFLKPPAPVDGVAPCVLAVRDVASGYQLLWEAFTEETAAITSAAIRGLFFQYQPPLVFKCDNGSPFIADATVAVLTEWDVTPLFSPPRLPKYNGACERGNGTLRTFTDEAAVLAGRRGVWLSTDLEQACDLHNEVHRPERLQGRTSADLWRERIPVGASEREEFLTAVELQRRTVLSQWGRPPDEALSRAGRAALDRIAVRNALCDLGYLTIKRRRVRDRALFRALQHQETGASSALVTDCGRTDGRLINTSHATSSEIDQATAPPHIHRIMQSDRVSVNLVSTHGMISQSTPTAARISVGTSSSGAQ